MKGTEQAKLFVMVLFFSVFFCVDLHYRGKKVLSLLMDARSYVRISFSVSNLIIFVLWELSEVGL